MCLDCQQTSAAGHTTEGHPHAPSSISFIEWNKSVYMAPISESQYRLIIDTLVLAAEKMRFD